MTDYAVLHFAAPHLRDLVVAKVAPLTYNILSLDDDYNIIANNIITVNERHIAYVENMGEEATKERIITANLRSRTPAQLSAARKAAREQFDTENVEKSPLPPEID